MESHRFFYGVIVGMLAAAIIILVNMSARLNRVDGRAQAHTRILTEILTIVDGYSGPDQE